MDLLVTAWQFIGNLDNRARPAAAELWRWIYLILFLIVFCETGLVVAPFLPGDSLLFASGALWAAADMPVELLALTLIGAALCGDNCNYWIGRLLGSRLAKRARSRFLNRTGPGADAREQDQPSQVEGIDFSANHRSSCVRSRARRSRNRENAPWPGGFRAIRPIQ